MINVILADYQAIFRVGTAQVLAAEDDIRIVAHPQSPEQLIQSAKRFRPHVILLSSDFLPVSPELLSMAKQERIALLMLAEKGENVAANVDPGFQGIICRSAQPKQIVRAVRCLARGEPFVQVIDDCERPQNCGDTGALVRRRLTASELRIMHAVICGYKNREIAQQISITEQMVKNYIRGIFDKLGVFDRLELALYVIHHKDLARAVASQKSTLVPRAPFMGPLLQQRM